MSVDWNLSPETRRAELVRRLRSGEYKQGYRALQRDGKFCCLGVACDMAEEVGVAISFIPDECRSVTYVGVNDSNGYSRSSLPPKVMGWIGFSSDFGLTSIVSLQDNGGHPDAFLLSLAELNDSGLTFDQIADVIEAGLVDVDEKGGSF